MLLLLRRAAPLSQGRVDVATGCLQCSYHGCVTQCALDDASASVLLHSNAACWQHHSAPVSTTQQLLVSTHQHTWRRGLSHSCTHAHAHKPLRLRFHSVSPLTALHCRWAFNSEGKCTGQSAGWTAGHRLEIGPSRTPWQGASKEGCSQSNLSRAAIAHSHLPGCQTL